MKNHIFSHNTPLHLLSGQLLTHECTATSLIHVKLKDFSICTVSLRSAVVLYHLPFRACKRPFLCSLYHSSPILEASPSINMLHKCHTEKSIPVADPRHHGMLYDPHWATTNPTQLSPLTHIAIVCSQYLAVVIRYLWIVPHRTFTLYSKDISGALVDQKLVELLLFFTRSTGAHIHN